MTMNSTPVACTLTSADLASQSERWKQLAAAALVDRTETEHGLRISFAAAPGVEEELRALVLVENECCAWAEWTVGTTPEEATLDVRSTGHGVEALHGMFTSLRREPR
jgi:hypothetical protein